VELAAAEQEMAHAVGVAGAGREGPSPALPASLREAIVAQCRRAGDAVAATLSVAALMGPVVDLDLLAATVRRTPLEILGQLEEGVRRRLLEVRGDTFAFRHELVREALVDGASAARRALVHREAAQLLAARPARDPLLVAHHARLGGDRELAAAALTEAAGRAQARYDHAAAERLLGEAITLADSPARRIERARVRILLGSTTEAEADALAALEAGGGAEALETAGWAAYQRRDLAATQRYADDGARLGSGDVRARCLALAGRVRHVAGDLPGAQDRLEEAVASAGDAGVNVSLAAWLAELRTHQGQGSEALDLAGPALRTPATPGLLRPAMHAYVATVHALGTLGRLADALAAADAWERTIERLQLSYYRAGLSNFRAWLLRAIGETGEADELNEQAQEHAQRIIARSEPLAHALLDLANGRLQAGDLDAAQAYLDAARPAQEHPHSHRWRHLLRARLLRARLALAHREAASARAMSQELERDAMAIGAARYADLAFLLGICAAATLAEPVDLEATARVVARLSERAGLEAWWITGEVAAATGVDAFWVQAEAYAAYLGAQAGPRAEGFRRYARVRLERIRMAGRRG
jgi:tetratricopeptide (TPR) repeat protein